MAKVTKERISRVCKSINQGMTPKQAARAEKLGDIYLLKMKHSGIIFKDPITKRWQGMLRIHDERYEKFTDMCKAYSVVNNARNYEKRKARGIKQVQRKPVRDTPKVGMFRRIWNSIFG